MSRFCRNLICCTFLLIQPPSGQLLSQGFALASTRLDSQAEPKSDSVHFKVGSELVSFQPGQVQMTNGARMFRVMFVNANPYPAQRNQISPDPKLFTSPKHSGKTTQIAQLSAADRVSYTELWAGINLVYERKEQALKSTYYVAPLADVTQIRLRYNLPVQVMSDGSLQWRFDGGTLKESPPVAWQETGKQRLPVTVRFEKGDSPYEVHLQAEKFDPLRPLVIDPTFEWHTFYGHPGFDMGLNVSVDDAGNIFGTGPSRGTWKGPSGESPLHDHSGGDDDIYVVKLDKDGNYLWHTFFGGAGKDWGWSVVPLGNAIFLQGVSRMSWLGPSGQAPLHAHSGGDDATMLRLSNSGAYVWHTFFGSPDNETTWGFSMDSTSLFLCGHGTTAWNGPSGQPPVHAFSGDLDLFVLKLNLNGGYVWHTFAGSSAHDQCGDLAVDNGGNVYVTGESDVTWQGPSGQSPLHANNDSPDFFVLKLDPNGAYVWHTFYGSNSPLREFVQDIQYDSVGHGLFLIGTVAGNFNGPGNTAPLNPYSGGYDVVIMRLSVQGGYLWHTFYGSTANEYGNGSQLGTDGSIYAAITSGGYWDGPGGIHPIGQFVGNPYDAGFLKLSPSGSYQWHAFFGASGDDQGTNMTLQGGGRNRVIGVGYSDATWNAPNTAAPLHPHAGNGEKDMFLVKILDETPVTVQFGQQVTTVLESIGGGIALVPVLLSSSSAETVTVGFETQNGSATAGSDYTSQSGTLTFLPGQMTNSVAIPITNDSTDEPDETIRILIHDPTHATLGVPASITVTIADDDNPNLETAPARINFNAVQGGNNPNPQAVTVSGITAWQANADASWIVLGSTSGNLPGNVNVSANIAGLAQGSYTGTITINAPGAANNTQKITTYLIVAASGGADQFEGDDSCAQAKSISTDGAIQPHSFHQQNDADWMTFNAISGTLYVLQAQLPPGSIADVTLEMFTACNAFPQTQNYAFSPGVRQEFAAQSDGPVYVKWSNSNGTLFGANTTYNVSINVRNNKPDLGAVIIIAGRYTDNDGLQPNIYNVTSGLYRMFLEHGYSADRIQYLAPNLTIPGVDGLATLSNVQATLETWVKQWLANGRSLTLYLMDHGGPDVFYLDGVNNQQLTPQQLDGWITALEGQYSGLKVNIIIDSCYSGSFIAEPDSVSKAGRVVIASTRPDYLAYASPTGAIFSDHFANALGRGESLFDSFLRANWSTGLAYPDQHPLLDDNGDRQANTASDGAEAQRRGFSFVGTFGPGTLATQSWPPFIEQAETQSIAGTFASRNLRARVLDNSQVSSVYAVIYPPDYQPPTVQSRLISQTLPTATLINQGDGWFSASWPGFTKLGRYRIVVYATDDKGEPAQPVEIIFNNGRFTYLPMVIR